MTIHKTSKNDLVKLQPSITLVQKQAINTKRTFTALCILQDFNHRCKITK
jgi:hypothetical protein